VGVTSLSLARDALDPAAEGCLALPDATERDFSELIPPSSFDNALLSREASLDGDFEGEFEAAEGSFSGATGMTIERPLAAALIRSSVVGACL
jgi:hypothetical protein